MERVGLGLCPGSIFPRRDSGLCFNNNGWAITDILGGADDYATSVAIQADGKIVVAGYSGWQSGGEDFVIVRYNSNGTLDTTFGSAHTGKVADQFYGSHNIATSVAIQADGKIVVAGQSTSDFLVAAMARYNSDGTRDTTSFGPDSNGHYIGIVLSQWGSDAPAEITSLAIQPDGRIVAAGFSGSSFALARYNTDGSPDTSFSGDGAATTYFGGDALYSAYSVAIQPDGKIVAAGEAFSGERHSIVAARYTSAGLLDTSFNYMEGGPAGFVMTSIANGSAGASAVAVQPDGKIIAAGYANDGYDNDFALVRYDASQLTYTHNSGPWFIDAAMTLTDADDSNIASAAIQITGNYHSDEDFLNIDSQDLAAGVSAAWDDVHGKLTLTTVTGVTTKADYESMLEHVTYTNTSSSPVSGARTVGWTVNDGSADSPVQDSTVWVNDAPVLDNTGAMNLPWLTAEQTTNAGVTVASIIASAGGNRITDVNSGAVEGIAITAADQTYGWWQYATVLTDQGPVWNDLNGVSDSSALLLSDTDLIRFLPDGVHGEHGTITFHAWDQTTGAAGNKAILSPIDGATSFSVMFAQASIDVVPITEVGFKLFAPDPYSQQHDRLGLSSSVSGDWAVVGAYNDTVGLNGVAGIRIYFLSRPGRVQQLGFGEADHGIRRRCARRVRLFCGCLGDWVVVGAEYGDVDPAHVDYGAAYIFIGMQAGPTTGERLRRSRRPTARLMTNSAPRCPFPETGR